jgi:origin recognition complex subunit 4
MCNDLHATQRLSAIVDTTTAAMDDSPRSSKRRKLDTPKRIASSPLVKESAKRASGRLASRVISHTNGAPEAEEGDAPQRMVRLAKSATTGTTAKRNGLLDVDIYDDIEGALSVEPSPRPARRRLVVASRDGVQSTTDELQAVAPTPKRGRGRPTNAERALVGGDKHGVDGRADTQHGVTTGSSTPAPQRKSTRTPIVSTRKAAGSRLSASRRAMSPTVEENGRVEELALGAVRGTSSKPQWKRKTATSARKRSSSDGDDRPSVATPSRSLKRQQPVQERTTMNDTQDELGQRAPPSSMKQTTSARRQFNRTDNISNLDEDATIEVDAESNDQDNDAMDVDGNSVLESVLDPTEPSPFNKPTSAQKDRGAPPLIYGNLPAGRELDLLKTIVLERITAKRSSPLVGLDAEYKSVHQLVEQTVTAGEGNSMLLIGARGSGKTALVNKVLSEVSKDNGGEYHVVRLNGFIHTDDKIALREIWRQLGKEMAVEEDGSGPGKNYADTLTTLLALLSHPSEQTGELTDQVAKAVIFVIDEFDLFAQHPRQTLLYNLFDIAQSRKAPIAVMGLTTRIDVTNSLEKRVKSRFSHRYVHLSLAKTFTTFQEMLKAALTIEPEHLSVEERGILEDGTKSATAHGIPAKNVESNVLIKWNANINVSSSKLRCTIHMNNT